MSPKRREVLSAGAMGLSGCTALAGSESSSGIQGPIRWEMYGRGPAHRANYENGAIPSKTPSTDQSFELTGNIATSPVASEEILAVGDERGVLVVPFADRELPRWVEPPGTVAGTPCLDGRTIYVTSDGRSGKTDTASVLAMTADGETMWRRDLSADIVTSPTVRDGTVFVRSDRAYIAFDADSGKTRWQNPDAGRLTEIDFLAFENVGPAAGNDVVVFPDEDGIASVDPTDGTIRWRRQLRKVRSCPVIADGTVYVSDVQSGIHALDIATGDRKWDWLGTGCWAPPVVSNERVYAEEGGYVIALDRASGDLEWRMQHHGLHGSVQSGFSLVGDTLLASSTGFGLVSVRTKSEGPTTGPGTRRWTFGESGFNTPLVIDDCIAFVEYGGDGPTLRVMN